MHEVQSSVKEVLPVENIVSEAIPVSDTVYGPDTGEYSTHLHTYNKKSPAKIDTAEPEIESLKNKMEEEQERVSQPPPPQPQDSASHDKPTTKRAKLVEKIRELEESRRRLGEKVLIKTKTEKPAGKGISEIIARYEKLLSNCTDTTSERCADVIYTLGGLYYDKSRDEYIRERESYERARDSAARHPGTPEPQNPVPDYSQPVKMYKRLVTEYPDFRKLDEAYYQMGTIYMLLGDIDNAKKLFLMISKKYPKSPRASDIRVPLSELGYLEHDYEGTIALLEKAKESEVDAQTWEMVHYRKAEMYHSMKEYDKAANLFYTYVEKCDAGLYTKCEFRDMALEFLAICYADMKDGPAKVAKFFRNVGPKPYEPYVLYTIGWKCERHGALDHCITVLSTALKKFPLYHKAPLARQTLAECYSVKKKFDKANEEREHLVDDYGPQSEWAAANAGRPRGEGGGLREEQRNALSAVAAWYYARAVKEKNPSIIGKAHQRSNEFIDRFSFDTWRCYELRYRSAGLYEQEGNCGNAAEQYRIVAMEDLSGYPEYRPDTVTDAVEAAINGVSLQTSGPKIAQDEAGYKVIVLLDDCLKKKIIANSIPPEKSYELPETKEILDYAERFLTRFPQSTRVAGVLRLTGNLYYAARQLDKAEECFRQADELFKVAEAQNKPPVLDERAIREVRSKRAELMRK